jgi:hypothetical protein
VVGLGEFEFGFTGKVFEKGFKWGVAEPGDEFETFVETAEIEGGVQFDGLGLEHGFTGKVGGDELANFGRDLGDMADGAGGGAHTGLSFSEAWFQ